jgi:cardiolipin synthase (CMP-forming)
MSSKYFTWNTPNILSLYRILCFPVIIWFVWQGNKDVFIILLSINLITDILDGFIARRFNMMTQIGARLDSIADIFTYICAGAGLIRFEWNMVTDHPYSLGLFALLYVLGFAVGFIRFGRVVGLHIYLFKITGYLQGIFIFVLFVFGYIGWFYYLMISVGIWANLEDLIILLILKAPRSNVKGLYWVLKDKNL